MRLRKYFNLRYERRSRLSNIITLLLIGTVLFIAAVFTYGKLVESYAEDIIVSTINNLVEKQSKGRYVFEYDSVAIDVWRNKVNIQDLSLRLKLDKTAEVLDDRVFNAEVKEVQLDIYNLWKWWMSDDLIVQKVILNQPHFVIVNPKKDLTEQEARETGRFMQNLGKQLDVLQIQELKVRDGSISFYKRNRANQEMLMLDVPNFSLSISDFVWDIEQKVKHFDSEKFYVEIQHQDLILPDSSAELKIDKLQYSMLNDRLLVSGITIFPFDSYNTIIWKNFITIIKTFYSLTITRFI